MILAFIAAGIGNFIRTKLIKHHYTLFLNIAAAISAACLVYALLLKLSEVCFGISSFHEAGYILSLIHIFDKILLYSCYSDFNCQNILYFGMTAHLLFSGNITLCCQEFRTKNSTACCTADCIVG